MDLSSSVREAKGIGPKSEELLHKLGVYSVSDMLLSFPRSYVQYPEPVEHGLIEVGRICAVAAHPTGRVNVHKTARVTVTSCNVTDGYITLLMTWFNAPFVAKLLKEEREYIFYGKVLAKGGRFVMEQPKLFRAGEYDSRRKSLQPVYRLTEGLKNQTVVKAVSSILEEGLCPPEVLPESVLKKYGFAPQKEAIRQIHFPQTVEEYEQARRKFAYEEFFLFLIGIRFQKASMAASPNAFPITDDAPVFRAAEHLPYSLTDGQRQALEDILSDVSSDGCMQRLIQGDVGCGKTVIAFMVMLLFSCSGYQSALMAPTETLAKQHYASLQAFLAQQEADVPVYLLTGSMKQAEKKLVYHAIQDEAPCMVIGTHALIQDAVSFANLGLVITDEQHRFGVRQRRQLYEKGACPHILVMSATPIPRTLSLILYGDLDVSVISELPKERLPVKNAVIGTDMRKQAYRKIYSEIKNGHQAYIICPLVEHSDEIEAEDVEEYTGKLRGIFPREVRIDCLNGRMKSAEKERIMEDFVQNRTQILVSTTVIEVGINVPNATVMLIENAERFGLAQLHQIRGRVGRGSDQSYCILVNGSGKPEAAKRLEILKQSNDGFEIAQEDLKLRGPGEYFGERQSGDMRFRTASIYEDADLLQAASYDAAAVLKNDPDLSRPEHAAVRERVRQYMHERESYAGL